MKQILYILLAYVVFALASCMGEEEYSTSAHDRLHFSSDTLAFDTVISGEATNTYTFQVFNRNKKALRINSIRLGQGAASPFEVNVDGTWLKGGESPFEFTISGNDSLRVFVQLLAPAGDNDDPQPLEDNLQFTLENGVTQEVLFTAASQDVNVLRGKVIEKSQTLRSNRPYQIYDSLVVAEGATLTLAEGTRLYFHPDASLIVHGKLIAAGSMSAPIVMRGDRLGNMFDGQPYDRIPGQWGGITFTGESIGNDMTWCDIHSGSYGIRCDSTGLDKQKLIIDNSIIHNVSHDAFYAKYCQAYVGNCQITNAGGNCVNLIGGDYTFVHCTVGQFYSFEGGHGVALQFTNTESDAPIPLERCLFVNCLISGYNDDDIMGSASERHKECSFNYTFKNCLLNTPKVDSEAIVDCLFEDKKDYDYEAAKDSTMRAGNFLPKFDHHELVFPFTLNPKSRAVGAADLTLTKQSGYVLDLKGRSRIADGKADIGAFEAIIEEE